MVKKSPFVAKLLPWRIWVQVTFALLWLDPFNVRMHSVCGPVFHCYACPLAAFACPVGVIAQFGAIHVFPFLAVGLLIVLGCLFGSLICGWACPFGFLQDLAAKVHTRKFEPPRWTAHFRYVVLIGTVLLVPYLFGEGHWLFICRLCPAGAIEGAVPSMAQQALTGSKVVWPNVIKLTILATFLVAIFFVRRPWCRILCPLGAVFSLFNRVSAFFLRFNPEKCNDCRRCERLCEYGIEPQISPNDSRCLRCLECTRCGPEAITFQSIFSKTPAKSQ